MDKVDMNLPVAPVRSVEGEILPRTREPGYYWVWWPGEGEPEVSEWACHQNGDGEWYRMGDPGPFIEEPSTVYLPRLAPPGDIVGPVHVCAAPGCEAEADGLIPGWFCARHRAELFGELSSPEPRLVQAFGLLS